MSAVSFNQSQKSALKEESAQPSKKQKTCWDSTKNNRPTVQKVMTVASAPDFDTLTP